MHEEPMISFSKTIRIPIVDSHPVESIEINFNSQKFNLCVANLTKLHTILEAVFQEYDEMVEVNDFDCTDEDTRREIRNHVQRAFEVTTE